MTKSYLSAFQLIVILLCFGLFPTSSFSQGDRPGVYVDDQGIMRWGSNDEEVKGFGVNYTVPFAHAFRSAQKLGVDPFQAIDRDVYHFARLGFDLYRVHVWDTEVSDTLGNLLFNEHLHAFDYLLKKLRERGINYVLTPMAYWGNGWPEPDQPTPGFSYKYGKGDCLTNEEAIKAQENYLFQFMNHVNPYTGIAYKDDPYLVAVEIGNEPHHGGEGEAVTAFVRRMVNAVKRSGYDKPVFYNISHSVHFVNDYFAGGIDGGTFQWYPTGLTFQKEVRANILPNVDDYRIPFDADIRQHRGARLVYEFDAADIAASYPYPAMARSFRKAGIQIATHFSYDPTFLAYANTEYNTHYMNLVYTPGKALSLMIAGEVFHRVPLYKDYGRYPENTTFDGFSVSYEKDLATLNVAEKYYYTNHTDVPPVAPEELRQIAGRGNSPLVRYDGTGAYFLDKLEDGVWRLEVLPDALTVENPFGRNSLRKTVGVVQWNSRSMTLDLPGLDEAFTIDPLNEGNRYGTAAEEGSFRIQPGAYLIKRAGRTTSFNAASTLRNMRLGEFSAPETSVYKTYVVHETPPTAVSGRPLRLTAQVIAPETDLQVQLIVGNGFRGLTLDMERTSGFTYEATIPAERIQPGELTYYLIVRGASEARTFPAGSQVLPSDWDFFEREPYRVRVITDDQPITLLDAQTDREHFSLSRWSRGMRLLPLDHPAEAEFQLAADRLTPRGPAHPNQEVITDLTLRHFPAHRLPGVREQLAQKQTLLLKARALHDRSTPLQVAVVLDDGSAYGATITLRPDLAVYEIPIADLKPIPAVTMPRPYPTFLPYFFSPANQLPPDLSRIEGIQLSIGPGIPENQLDEAWGIGLVWVQAQ